MIKLFGGHFLHMNNKIMINRLPSVLAKGKKPSPVVLNVQDALVLKVVVVSLGLNCCGLRLSSHVGQRSSSSLCLMCLNSYN